MNIKPADIWFGTSPYNPVSAAIRQRTWGKFSHAMLMGTVWPLVVSADEGGVQFRKISEKEFQNPSEVLTMPDLPQEKRWEILERACEQIGKGYDFLGLGDFVLNVDMQDGDRWFCSELVFWAYREVGIDLLKRVKPGFVSPRDLYISPLLEVVI